MPADQAGTTRPRDRRRAVHCRRDDCGEVTAVLVVRGLEERTMARVCDICGKHSSVGNSVSHANNRTKRRWQPNLQHVRAKVGGSTKRIRACTQCIRSGKVHKAA